MAEEEFVFDFTRVDDFLDNMNRDGKFDTLEMDGITPNYRMVLVSDCPDDVNECLDEDGTLLSDDVVHRVESLGVDDGKCALLWSKGINGERTLSITTSSVVYDLGNLNDELKAVFLVNGETGYVLAYAINSYSFPIDGQVILPCDGMVCSIVYGG